MDHHDAMKALLALFQAVLHFHVVYTFRVHNDTCKLHKFPALQTGRTAPESVESKDTLLVKLITPPPNLTGDLHVGNALNLVCSDIYLKYCELRQKLLHVRFGNDHAGLGLEGIINRNFANEANSRQKLRHAMKTSMNLMRKHVNTIRKLGIDWLPSVWTLSKRSKDTTRDAFLRFYKDGHIKERLYPTFCTVTDDRITWLNAAKIEKVTMPVESYAITLDVVDGNDTCSVLGKVIAYTTQPGLLHATAAVVVSQEDYERYKGKLVVIPGSMKRVPLFLKDDMQNDSSCHDRLIMPGYSQDSITIANKYGLEVTNLVDSHGRLTNVPPELLGKSLSEADAIMKKQFEHYKTFIVEVPTLIGDKNTKVHTLPASCLFLDTAAISEPALKVIGQLEVDPPNRLSMLKQRLISEQPWCISRYGWWGVRVPIWYLDRDGETIAIPAHSKLEAEKLIAERLDVPLEKAIEMGFLLRQDERILDTWFTSSLWPLTQMDPDVSNVPQSSTKTLLYTCYDILHSWVARMLLVCTYISGNKLPFEKLVLHGMIHDSEGKKMSKSVGNTINADEFVERFTDRGGFPDVFMRSTKSQRILELLGGTDEYVDPLAIAQARLSLASTASKVNHCHNIGDYDERIKGMLKKLGHITNYIRGMCKKCGIEKLWDLDTVSKETMTSLEAAIEAQFSRAIISLSNEIESFEFRKAVESLEKYVSVFSHYAIPANRHGDCKLEVLVHWYIDLLRMMMPFAVQMIQAMSLPLDIQTCGVLMEWPKLEHACQSALGMFETMEDIIRQLRRFAHEGLTEAVVSVPEEYLRDLTPYKKLLSYIVQLTYNTNIDFNME